MSAAFRLNLTVLSLGALAVGAYLLFQAFDAAVNRRRETWALSAGPGLSARPDPGPGPGRGGPAGQPRQRAGAPARAGPWPRGPCAAWPAPHRPVRRLIGPPCGPGPREAAIAFLAGTLTCLAAAWLPAGGPRPHRPVQLLARGARPGPCPGRPWPWAAGPAGAGLAIAFLSDQPPGALWPAYAGVGAGAVGGSLASPALLPALGPPAAGPAPGRCACACVLLPAHRAPRLCRRRPGRGRGHDRGHGRDGAQLRSHGPGTGSATA